MITVLLSVVGKLASATLCEIGAHDPRAKYVQRKILGGSPRVRYVIATQYELGVRCSSCGLEFPDVKVDLKVHA